MADLHADRDHASWSASASERLWNCPGSLALNARPGGLPDKESFAAAWGTACHQISEKCLRDGGDAIQFLDTVEETKEHSIPVDEEVCETAQVYLDYVREQQDLLGAELLIEQKFSLDSLKPPFDAGGTGDAVLLASDRGIIEIIDLKGGRGIVVEAKGNKQLRTYGLGAVLANPGPWNQVKVTVVQPRAGHKDGRIRSEVFDVADLLDWTVDLMAAMGLSSQAQKALAEVNSKSGASRIAAMAAWVLDYLEAGDHCTFCGSKIGCPAIEAKALEVAHTHFNDETNKLAAPPDPADLDMDQIVRVLDHADMIQGWLNSVRAYAQDQAELGLDVASGDSVYVLTPKIARRKWIEGDKETTEALAKQSKALGAYKPADFYADPKPMSPAQVEKFLGKKEAKAVLSGLVEQKSSGFNLTRSDKTTREAVLAPPKQFFNNEKDN